MSLSQTILKNRCINQLFYNQEKVDTSTKLFSECEYRAFWFISRAFLFKFSTVPWSSQERRHIWNETLVKMTLISLEKIK